LSRQEFLDLIAVTNIIPGPNSTEMAIHIGYRQAGYAGLVVAGIAFIVPSAILVLALAYAYVRAGSLPELTALLYGVKPVIVGILVQAVLRLGRAALTAPSLITAAAVAVLLAFTGLNELVVLF